MQKHLIFGIVITLLLALAGCGGNSSSQEPTLGKVLLNEGFNEPGAWETFTGGNANLQVLDGVYRITTASEGYIWGLNEQAHNDVVIEVETNQLSAHENNAYGVMCRADTSNNGDGYYFMISGDRFYTIAKGEGPEVRPLVDWTKSNTINGGRARNTIRAVCIGNYLALYVNGKLLAQTNDNTYTSGYTGLSATAFEGGNSDITFDNMTIWEASLGN